MENVIKWLSAAIPFIAGYPTWVKLAFGGFLAFGVIFVIGLIFAYRPTPPPPDPAPASTTVRLVIHGVTQFGSGPPLEIRVTATVNGIDYDYPSLPGVSWLRVGPTMSAQDFVLPTNALYDVSFEAVVKNGSGPDRRLASVSVEHVAGQTNGIASYMLREVMNNTRGADIVAEVRYSIVR